jgi:uncharacterized membrane protein YgcG
MDAGNPRCTKSLLTPAQRTTVRDGLCRKLMLRAASHIKSAQASVAARVNTLVDVMLTHVDTLSDLDAAVKENLPDGPPRRELLRWVDHELPRLCFPVATAVASRRRTAGDCGGGGGGGAGGGSAPSSPGGSSGRTSPRASAPNYNNKRASAENSQIAAWCRAKPARRGEQQQQHTDSLLHKRSVPLVQFAIPDRVNGRNFHVVLALPPHPGTENLSSISTGGHAASTAAATTMTTTTMSDLDIAKAIKFHFNHHAQTAEEMAADMAAERECFFAEEAEEEDSTNNTANGSSNSRTELLLQKSALVDHHRRALAAQAEHLLGLLHDETDQKGDELEKLQHQPQQQQLKPKDDDDDDDDDNEEENEEEEEEEESGFDSASMDKSTASSTGLRGRDGRTTRARRGAQVSADAAASFAAAAAVAAAAAAMLLLRAAAACCCCCCVPLLLLLLAAGTACCCCCCVPAAVVRSVRVVEVTARPLLQPHTHAFTLPRIPRPAPPAAFLQATNAAATGGPFRRQRSDNNRSSGGGGSMGGGGKRGDRSDSSSSSSRSSSIPLSQYVDPDGVDNVAWLRGLVSDFDNHVQVVSRKLTHCHACNASRTVSVTVCQCVLG